MRVLVKVLKDVAPKMGAPLLTFEDGPSESTAQVLDLLASTA